MARAVLAVVVGFVVWSILWVALGAGMQAAWPAAYDERGLTSSTGVLATCLAGSVAISLVSGLVAALIARPKATGAAWALGIALLAVGIAVQASVWSALPLWYHLPFLALLIPATLIGATFAHRGQSPSTPAH